MGMQLPARRSLPMAGGTRGTAAPWPPAPAGSCRRSRDVLAGTGFRQRWKTPPCLRCPSLPTLPGSQAMAGTALAPARFSPIHVNQEERVMPGSRKGDGTLPSFSPPVAQGDIGTPGGGIRWLRHARSCGFPGAGMCRIPGLRFILRRPSPTRFRHAAGLGIIRGCSSASRHPSATGKRRDPKGKGGLGGTEMIPPPPCVCRGDKPRWAPPSREGGGGEQHPFVPPGAGEWNPGGVWWLNQAKLT